MFFQLSSGDSNPRPFDHEQAPHSVLEFRHRWQLELVRAVSAVDLEVLNISQLFEYATPRRELNQLGTSNEVASCIYS